MITTTINMKNAPTHPIAAAYPRNCRPPPNAVSYMYTVQV